MSGRSRGSLEEIGGRCESGAALGYCGRRMTQLAAVAGWLWWLDLPRNPPSCVLIPRAQCDNQSKLPAEPLEQGGNLMDLLHVGHSATDQALDSSVAARAHGYEGRGDMHARPSQLQMRGAARQMS